ncbi:MAG: hypothetical protein HRT86_03825 [Ilumatobacteraceae bacterium]|nr:hypothetical protein [Ilumatobacteraceae bacterium]
MIAFFDDAGFILGSYALTVGLVGLLSWRYVRRGSQLGQQIPDDEKPWR